MKTKTTPYYLARVLVFLQMEYKNFAIHKMTTMLISTWANVVVQIDPELLA
ncbi:MAG: hypothetical protein WCF60_17055 [Anaerobacillus sp.]